MTPTADRRLLLVHAHPDDESIGQGATMAKYVAEGVHVTLVTCTAGEEGEILVPEEAHRASDKDDTLAEVRREELAAAMAELGVTDHRFLGGFGTYRDSGMEWHDQGHAVIGENIHEKAFWIADLTEAANHLVTVIREVRPQVMVTYDQFGGYGHPDHIQAHRIAMAAAERSGVPDKLYYTAIPREGVRQMIQTLRDSGVDIGFDPPEDFGTPDELITSMLDVSAHTEAKRKALQAHASQAENIFLLRMPEEVQQAAFSFEAFVRRFSRVEAPGKEDDLFAGLR